MKFKIPGKAFFLNPNPDIVFDLSYLPVAAVGTWQVRYRGKIVKNIKSDSEGEKL